MNTKRITFWISFIAVLALIVWGLIAAMNKSSSGGITLAKPAAVSATDHVRGPLNASATATVTLIEYGDFQCPACGTYFPYVERLFNESSTTLRLVFRNFPLTQHVNAIPAALASEAAAVQGKYWEMYKLLYEHQSEWSEVSNPAPLFEKYAREIGLDATKFQADQKNPALRQKINSDLDEGIHIGINQTPTFFLNGKVISPRNYDEFKAAIQAAN